MRIVLACQESAGARAVELAVDHGCEVLAVLTETTRESFGASGVASTAVKSGIDVRPADLVRDPAFGAWLISEGIDLLLNVHSLYVANPAVVKAPSIGSFNLHPGPLPDYPGLNAPSWGTYDGAATFGCTVHWMDATVDTGPIAYAESFRTRATDTGLTLMAGCVRRGLPLLARLLADASKGGAAAIPRIEQRGQRIDRGPGPPHDGRVRWWVPAARIAAFVRACDYGPFPSPWGKPRAELGGHDVAIVRASAIANAPSLDAEPGEVIGIDGADAIVATGDGALRIMRLVWDGTPVAPADVVVPGARFSA